MAAAVAALVFAGGMLLRFGDDPELPARPKRPSAAADLKAFRALDYSASIYRAGLEREADILGVPADPLTGVFVHTLDRPASVLVAGGPPLETRELTLSLRVARLSATLQRGSITSEHAILRIANRTDDHLAYHVVTRPPLDPRGCIEKAALAHNAIALAPGEVIERTECGRTGVHQLTIDRVETMKLPALAFHLVSRLHPVHAGLDARAAQGHRPPHDVICDDVPEQAIRRAMEKSEASWRDVLDFYARHDRRTYIFPVQYRSFTRPGERALPARPQGSAARP
jgi:hypothetical protein